MKTLLFICASLMAFNVAAEQYMLKIDFVAPTEREQCVEKSADKSKCLKWQPLAFEEITGYTLWVVDCDNPVPAEPTVEMLPPKQHSYWFASAKPKECVIMTAHALVDKEGTETSESLYSDVFTAIDFRAPKATTCTP